ncbi:hypothetical protein AQUCO_00900150v1, partial [Aquilegia coerulea]
AKSAIEIEIEIEMRRGSEVEMKGRREEEDEEEEKIIKRMKKQKPQFKPAEDDTKPVLRDPILRSDPIETEEVFLRLPPFPFVAESKPNQSK